MLAAISLLLPAATGCEKKEKAPFYDPTRPTSERDASSDDDAGESTPREPRRAGCDDGPELHLERMVMNIPCDIGLGLQFNILPGVHRPDHRTDVLAKNAKQTTSTRVLGVICLGLFEDLIGQRPQDVAKQLLAGTGPAIERRPGDPELAGERLHV